MVHLETNHITIIDFGLSVRWKRNQKRHHDVYPEYYRPPDIFLGNRYYDMSADIWAAGTLFASMIFKVNYFFDADDDED